MAQAVTSYIRTTGAAATREADVLNAVLNARPQALTIYVRFVELGSVLSTSSLLTGVVAIGDVANTPRVAILTGSGGIGVYEVGHGNGMTTSLAQAAAAPVIGNGVEIVAQLNPDGTVAIIQSINGGAAVTVTSATAVALSQAWVAKTIQLGAIQAAGAFLAIGLRNVVVARGTFTLQQMQKMARVI